MKQILFLAAAVTGAFMASASAQVSTAYQQRGADLVELASIFGELHHIRRTCEPRLEADVWRERMKKLVELEEPQAAVHEEMIARFNSGYSAAQQRFPSCEREARDHAAARARLGETIIARLMAPLYETMAQEKDTPFVWRGTTGPTGD